jgi:hypothetical protein
MVRRRTFYERDFFTTSLRVVWISETSCKSLSINDLRAQGGCLCKRLINKNLQNLILRQNLNESKRSNTLIIKHLQKQARRARKSLIDNDLRNVK